MKLSELKKTLVKPTVEPVRNVYESGNRRSIGGRELPARVVVVPAPTPPTRTLSRIFGERIFLHPAVAKVTPPTLAVAPEAPAVGGKSVTEKFTNPFAPSPLHIGGVLLAHPFETRKEHIVHDEDSNIVSRRHLRRDPASGFLIDDGPAV